MSGTASVTAFYALFAVMILLMWRTSSWIGLDGLISGYRQGHPDAPVNRVIDRVSFPLARERAPAATVGAHQAG